MMNEMSREIMRNHSIILTAEKALTNGILEAESKTQIRVLNIYMY